ncbi:MAG: DUF6220 domain-containing protein [Gaiellaceae bacterium]
MDRQRIGTWGTFVFAALAVIGMAVQVYLIGGFIFGETGWLDTHKDLGKIVHLLYVLTFLSALLAAWPNWRAAAWPFALAVLGSIQAFLAGGGDVGGDNGALHAFHAALVPIVFLIALAIAWRAWKSLQGESQPAVSG